MILNDENKNSDFWCGGVFSTVTLNGISDGDALMNFRLRPSSNWMDSDRFN